MAKKVHPHGLLSSSSSSSSSTPCYFTSKQETFTIWMKSLVLNGKGCTVFDSDGHIKYRVDNYNSKSSSEVYLLDFDGRVLFTILRKKYFRLFGYWEGYRSTGEADINPQKPGFRVKKSFKISGRNSVCDVILGLETNEPYNYVIASLSNKCSCACKIVDKFGEIIAEIKRKEATGGVVFGEDVLTMDVRPCVDHSLITGLLVVYGLINNIM